MCDHFVIAGGTSTTQAGAIADGIRKAMKDAGERLLHAEGEREALWIILDYGDVVAHIFNDETRRYYDLESLWSDLPQRRFKDRIRRRIRPVSARRVPKKASRKKALRKKAVARKRTVARKKTKMRKKALSRGRKRSRR